MSRRAVRPPAANRVNSPDSPVSWARPGEPTASRPPTATATGTTLYEGKALVAAVAVAEWTVPGLAIGLAVVGVAVMGRFGMMLILARRHYRQRNKRRFSWGRPSPVPSA